MAPGDESTKGEVGGESSGLGPKKLLIDQFVVVHQWEPRQFRKVEALLMALIVALGSKDQNAVDRAAASLKNSSDELQKVVDKLSPSV